MLPETPRRPVELHFHGETVVDPYLWLEDGDDPEVQRWWKAQDARTREVLAGFPGRGWLEERLHALLSLRTLSPPVPRGDRLFVSVRPEGAQQPRLVVREGDEERVLVDPERDDPAALTAVDWWAPSPGGRYLVTAISRAGTERGDLTVWEVETGEAVERIPRVRYPTVAWLPDEGAFYYTRMPREGEVPPEEAEYHWNLYFHRLGEDPAEDPHVFGADRDMTEHYTAQVDEDGRFLVVTAMKGLATRNEVLVARLDEEGPPVFRRITPDVEALFWPVPLGDTLYLQTDREADRWRVEAVPLEEAGERDPQVVVPEEEDRLLEVMAAGGGLLLHYLERTVSRLEIWREGERRAVELPPFARLAEGVTGHDAGSRHAYVAVSGFTLDPQVLRVDSEDGSTEVVDRVEVPVDLSAFVQERTTARSADGTEVLVWTIRRGDLPRHGQAPTVLAGYGGFDIPYPTAFLPQVVPWLEAGGLYAVAHLRGGGEFGAAWHRAGMLGEKQNVFDDFLAAAEHLVAGGWTSPGRLAVYGRSNGGLLTGAALTQRPELFRAVVIGVPLLDMLRYQERLIARLWISEYGSAEEPDAYRWLRAYSPYHRVEEGTPYPAVLLFTAEGDSRVDPMHARKMAAALQWATSSEHPVHLRVEEPAGHGVGKPVRLQVEEWADIWSFLMMELGLRAPS